MLRILRLIAILFLFLLTWNQLSLAQDNICELHHHLSLIHPGISETEMIPFLLIQNLCSQDGKEAFYTEVETVVCGDAYCRIDTVRIYWDELGFYDKMILPPDVQLEKAEGASFSPADYEKLDRILADRTSGIKTVRKYDLVGSEVSEGLDAISRATIVLDKNDYIKGAVWTSYTLWHWTNGEAHQLIRNISGDGKTEAQLRTLLSNAETLYEVFALEQFIRRQLFDKESVNIVANLKARGNYPIQKLKLAYAEKCAAEDYFSLIEGFLTAKDQQMSLLCLQSLGRSNWPISDSFHETLANLIISHNRYQEINLWINILEERNSFTPQLIDVLLGLLDHESFIVARRAYWGLTDQKLSQPQQQKLDVFYQKYLDQL